MNHTFPGSDQFDEIFGRQSVRLEQPHHDLPAGADVERLHDYDINGVEWCRCSYVQDGERKVISIPASKLHFPEAS